MSATIGIHQKQEQVDKLYENLGLTAASLTAVGPFATRDEALAWQQEMRDKVPGCNGPSDPGGRRTPALVRLFLRASDRAPSVVRRDLP